MVQLSLLAALLLRVSVNRTSRRLLHTFTMKLLPARGSNLRTAIPLAQQPVSMTAETFQSWLPPSADSSTSPTLPSMEMSESQDLKLVWLMSFPNSGTSYTTKLIRHVSLQDTATNYGYEHYKRPIETTMNHINTNKTRSPLESLGDTFSSVPVFVNETTGPFWHTPDLWNTFPRYTRPTHLVLTKTHCGMRCTSCLPHQYVETTFSFKRACYTGDVYLQEPVQNPTEASHFVVGKKAFVSYSERVQTKVAKAVHVIRNPFDNIVARFHLEQRAIGRRNEKRLNGQQQDEMEPVFSIDKDGFRAYCQQMNDHQWAAEQTMGFLENDVLRQHLFDGIPCRADFIRYVEWHNLAFATSMDENWPVYVLQYDWYEHRFNDTVTELLDFLELPRVGSPPEFATGKVYHDYFTDSERRAVAKAMKLMASSTTWRHLSTYLS